MNILICGGSGLIGTTLGAELRERGDSVAILSRSKGSTSSHYHWNPSTSSIDQNAIEWSDAVINLAGENVASGLWTKSKRARIFDSRVQSTELLVQSFRAASCPPKVLLNASAVGIYGSRGTELLTEESEPGEGFLAEVCKAWESASHAAEDIGTRVVSLRIGVVLSKDGGALQKMLLPFRLGLGGRLGNGSQLFPWISIADVLGSILHCLDDETLNGPVNICGPQAVSNLEFTKTLGRVLKRPTVLPVPAFMLRLLLGKMADEMLLASINATPGALEKSGYSFQHRSLESALRDVLDRNV